MADGKVVYEIRGDNSKFQSDVNQTENIAKSKTSAIGSFAKTAVVGIGAAVAAVGAGMVSFAKDAVGVGSEFDKSMSQVAATMGVTTDEIGNLRDFALEMGSTTAFSANEAAQALNYMALAGYDAETSMKMLPNVLNLAAAGNMSLARASDMVTDAQTALGLTLPETEKLVDKMAKTSSKSNTSVEQLGDAILTVGGTAKSLKGGTTELATILGVLADNSIKGSEGGTALRNVILALSAPTDTAAEKLKELGVSAYDADGNMRALPDVFADLNAAMDGMTQGQKTDVLNTIFNKVDLKSANALLGTSADRFKELQSAIEDSTGAAQTMAEVQLDNLAGDVTLFKHALDGAKITVSNALTPALRNFVQFGTREIQKLDKAFQKGGLNGLATQLGKTLGEAVQMLIKKVPAFVSAAGKLALALVDSLSSTLVSNFPKILKSLVKSLGDLARSLISRIPDLMGGIGSIIGETIANIPNLLKLGWDILKGLTEGIIKGIPKMAVEIGKGFKNLFSEPISEEVEKSNEYLDELFAKIENIGMSADEMYDSLAGVETDSKMAKYWLDTFDKLRDKTNLTKEEQYLLNKAVEELNKILPETQQIIKDETGHWSANTEEIYKNIEALMARQKAEVYLEKAKGTLEQIVELEMEADTLNAELFELKNRKDYLTPQLEEVSNAYRQANKYSQQFYRDHGRLMESWDDGSVALKAYAKSIGITEDSFTSWDEVMQSLYNKQQELQTELNETDSAIEEHEHTLDGVNDKIGELQGTYDGLIKKASEYGAEAERLGAAVGDGFAVGLKSKTPVVEAAAGGLAKSALNQMKFVAQIQSPSKRARKEVGAQIGQGEVLGLEDKIPDVKKASEKLINAIEMDVPSLDIPSVKMQGESDTRINAIIAVLNKYLPRIGAPIVLDTGELVGATVDKFDYELGVLQQRRARYE